MDEEEQNERINLWKKLAGEGKHSLYNGLDLFSK
jgi:hypothetical protein